MHTTTKIRWVKLFSVIILSVIGMAIYINAVQENVNYAEFYSACRTYTLVKSAKKYVLENGTAGFANAIEELNSEQLKYCDKTLAARDGGFQDIFGYPINVLENEKGLVICSIQLADSIFPFMPPEVNSDLYFRVDLDGSINQIKSCQINGAEKTGNLD